MINATALKLNICCNCRQIFSGPKNKVYCSNECKKEVHLNRENHKNRQKRNHQNCETCGIIFFGRKRRHCSDVCMRHDKCQCGNLKLKTNSKCRNCANKSSIRKRRCKWCRELFQTRSRDAITFCSRECSFDSKASIKLIKGRAKKAVKRFFARLKMSRYKCSECGVIKANESTNAKTRCDECQVKIKNKRREEYKARQRENYTPVERFTNTCLCGAVFISIGKTREVCKDCVNRAVKDRRRARKRLGRTQRIYKAKVFAAAEWKCRMCGCKTILDKKDYLEPNYATLDHIIPLSQGGTHTVENVMLLCRRCNTCKNDKVVSSDVKTRTVVITPQGGNIL